MKIDVFEVRERATALNEIEAARLVGVRVKTLRNWRVYGFGPPFLKVGSRLVRYRLGDLLDWQESNLRKSTSDQGGARG